ncbi:MAG: hypothetical protein A2148_09080 [Chloroflexi bacterium RBG_16_68_14]|nr:MAG: hypothetical protein A2148_09080 [Chloroflexi bacterium RBG_16_68_14]
MPEGSTIKKFVEALKSGRTNTTKALDTIFADASKRAAHSKDLGAPGAFNRPLAGWARTELRSAGLSEQELTHIDDWPDDQKEDVRQALVTAINGKRAIHLSWELHSGPAEATDIQGLAGTGDVTVTFRSPRSKMKVSLATFGDISVEV